MKVMVIPIFIGAHGPVNRALVQGLEDLKVRGLVETIQTQALSGSTKILVRVLET